MSCMINLLLTPINVEFMGFPEDSAYLKMLSCIPLIGEIFSSYAIARLTMAQERLEGGGVIMTSDQAIYRHVCQLKRQYQDACEWRNIISLIVSLGAWYFGVISGRSVLGCVAYCAFSAYLLQAHQISPIGRMIVSLMPARALT